MRAGGRARRGGARRTRSGCGRHPQAGLISRSFRGRWATSAVDVAALATKSTADRSSEHASAEALGVANAGHPAPLLGPLADDAPQPFSRLAQLADVAQERLGLRINAGRDVNPYVGLERAGK